MLNLLFLLVGFNLTLLDTSVCVNTEEGAELIFDYGPGAHAAYQELNIDPKVIFLSHLNQSVTHDLVSLCTSCREVTIYGPSGERPDKGTASSMRGLRQFVSPHQTVANLNVFEFDYSDPMGIIYNDGKTVIKTMPSFHQQAGSVNYRLEKDGVVIVFLNDEKMSHSMVELCRGADAVFSRSTVSPKAFGKMMSLASPRLVVTIDRDLDNIKHSYKGVLTEANPGDTYQVTKSKISRLH